MNASRTLVPLMLLAVTGSFAASSHAQVYVEYPGDGSDGRLIHPAPGSVYESASPLTIPAGPGGDFHTEIVSLTTTLDLASNRVDANGDGLLDYLDPDSDNDGLPNAAGLVLDHEPFVFYDIILSVSPPGGGGPPTDVNLRTGIRRMIVRQRCDLNGGCLAVDTEGGSNEYETELLQLELSGDLPGTAGQGGGGVVLLRSSLTTPSTGLLNVENLGDDTFRVDSFFDVILEVSYDDGANWTQASSPLRMELTSVVPEPSAAALALVGLGALVRRR